MDVFVEFGRSGREATWRLDVQRLGGVWQIFDAERLTVVERLFRISLDGTRQFNALNLTISVEDLDVALDTGRVFFVSSDAGVTGVVLVGRGEMRFHPRPATEKGQVKIFCGSETLVAPFSGGFRQNGPV